MNTFEIRAYSPSTVPQDTPFLVVGVMQSQKGICRMVPAELIMSDMLTGKETLIPILFTGDYACSG